MIDLNLIVLILIHYKNGEIFIKIIRITNNYKINVKIRNNNLTLGQNLEFVAN